jgi:hypothetical protein
MANLTGQQVMETSSTTATQGNNSLAVNTATLAESVYFLNLFVGDRTHTQRVLIAK